jgi:hypothetical protein
MYQLTCLDLLLLSLKLTCIKGYFDGLASAGLWSGNTADTIALLFVYMPILRREIYGYADLWNAHTIRRQARRPAVVSGKPVVLYFQPPAPAADYGSMVPENRHQQLMQTVEAYNPNEYLPTVTTQFCQRIFDLHAIDLQLQPDGGLDYTAIIGEPPVALHHVAYILLRDSINQYLASGNELLMSQIPRGAYNWVPPAAVPPEVDLHEYEPGSIYDGSDGPEYLDWNDRYLDGHD